MIIVTLLDNKKSMFSGNMLKECNLCVAYNYLICLCSIKSKYHTCIKELAISNNQPKRIIRSHNSNASTHVDKCLCSGIQISLTYWLLLQNVPFSFVILIPRSP